MLTMDAIVQKLSEIFRENWGKWVENWDEKIIISWESFHGSFFRKKEAKKSTEKKKFLPYEILGVCMCVGECESEREQQCVYE